MERNDLIINPIYYCTDLNYETPSDKSSNQLLFFSITEIKSSEESTSIDLCCEPFSEGYISEYEKNPSCFLNIVKEGNRYSINTDISLDDYFTLYNKMLEMGISEDDISAIKLRKFALYRKPLEYVKSPK